MSTTRLPICMFPLISNSHLHFIKLVYDPDFKVHSDCVQVMASLNQ